MTAPEVTRVPRGYRVTCPEHRLDRTVATEQHATNIVGLHLRVDHPDTTEAEDPIVALDLSAAASMVVAMWSIPGRGLSALSVWEALTGLEPDEALAYAEELSAAPGTVTAVLPPF